MIDMLSDDGNSTTDDDGNVVPTYQGVNSPKLYGRPANPHRIRAVKTQPEDLVLQHPEEATGHQTDEFPEPEPVAQPGTKRTIAQKNASEAAHMAESALRKYEVPKDAEVIDPQIIIGGIASARQTLEQHRNNPPRTN